MFAEYWTSTGFQTYCCATYDANRRRLLQSHKDHLWTQFQSDSFAHGDAKRFKEQGKK